MATKKKVETVDDGRQYTVAEKHGIIGRFLKDTLELGGMIKVHSDGTISYASRPDEPIMLKVAGDPEPRPLVIYRTQIEQPRAIVINPFVEPVGEDPTDKLWFYNTTNTIHATTLTRIVEFLFTNVIKAASGGTVDDPTLVHVLSGLVNSADEKTEKEFAKIVKTLPEFDGGLDEEMLNEITHLADHAKPKDFVTISRSKKDRKTILTTFLYRQENDLKKKFGNKIRKKTWVLIEKLFKEIYATEDIYNPIFEETTDQKRCPTFLTYIKVLINSWNKFIPYLHYLYGDDGAQEMVEKIIFLESCLNKLDDLSTVAHWARGCINGKLQLGNGEVIEEIDSQTLMDRVRPRDNREREPRERDPYLEEAKAKIERSVNPEPSGRSALSIMEDQAYDERRRFDRRYYDDRDRYYDRRPIYDDRRYERRDDYGSRRGDDRDRYGRTALDALRDDNRNRFDSPYLFDNRRGYDEPYRPAGNPVRFGF